MVTAVVNTHHSLLKLLGELRRQHSSSQHFQLLSLFVDSDAAKLTVQEWGALLGAIALPAGTQLRNLEVANISDRNVSALIVPHVARVAQSLCCLESFTLRKAALGARTAEYVGTCLSGHGSLRRIAVEQCDLRDDGTVAFLQSILSVETTRRSEQQDHESFFPSSCSSSSPSSPLEAIDLSHNNMTGGAATTAIIRSIVEGVVVAPTGGADEQSGNNNNNSAFANLFRVQMRGNHFVGATDGLAFFSEARKQDGEERQRKRGRKAPLPVLPAGDNLHFICTHASGGYPFPTLGVMASQVRHDLTPTQQ